MTTTDPLSLARRALAMEQTAGLALCEDGDDPARLFFAHYATETAAIVPDADDRAYIIFACNTLPALARALIASQEEADRLRTITVDGGISIKLPETVAFGVAVYIDGKLYSALGQTVPPPEIIYAGRP